MLYYQVLENPIVQNKNSDPSWDLIMEDPELEFQDSDMESLASDSESYVDDEFQNFSGKDSTIPSIIVVKESDSSESELESDLESELESESETESDFTNSDRKYQKISSVPSSIRIIELDYDSETSLEFQEFLDSDSGLEFDSGLDSNNFLNNTISWEDTSSNLEFGSESEHEKRKIEGQETEICFDEENSKHLMTVIDTKEDFESIKINIEFHGHHFKEKDLNIELEDKTTLIVNLEDSENKFERYFSFPNQCKMDKIKSKFSIWHKGDETIQTLHIKIPKEKVQQISLENSLTMPNTIVEE